MSKKEYPMDDDYNKALQFLTEQIAERDLMREQLKSLPPEARKEGLRMISELDKAIEKGEQALANEYDAFQNQRRLEEERDQLFDEATRGIAGMYVHAKYRNPEMIAGMDEIIAKMGPAESDAFYRYVDEIEAGDLVRIIRREGETREEAEEFLKNYRIQEEKERAALFQEFLEKYVGQYVFFKYRQPAMREKFDTEIARIPPEQSKEFYDSVAKLEAHYLIDCIALEGETREETEEFLKNYRAGQGNQ